MSSINEQVIKRVSLNLNTDFIDFVIMYTTVRVRVQI